jgi:hypothetical protein
LFPTILNSVLSELDDLSQNVFINVVKIYYIIKHHKVLISYELFDENYIDFLSVVLKYFPLFAENAGPVINLLPVGDRFDRLGDPSHQ